ncbi:MAG: Stk1 family PASTA domain-containing Ser/Thr kinase [Arcanobacterium sp.]|nr:Stk1 family PASTA domain-containing Ser/Thr kinase [Arcanobacterium sp.]
MSEIPRILGSRYEIGDLIGRGGMAQVHIGYDTRLSRTVAIKVLRADLAADPTFLARFRREAQSAAALNHPAIVSVYDTGEEQIETATGRTVALPYIVMEYVRGQTVSKLLANGEALPIDESIQIIAGVLSALEYSHQEGIIHRDIKPGNIMMTADGKIKVMDFGIARAIADSAATMTSTNSVVGTAQYLSPEQARGEVVDARSDLYSTGCLLYELLTGKPPFQGDSAVAVAYQHVSEAPKPPSSIAPDIPNAIDRAVMKSLAKRRESRYQTAAEMRQDLMTAMRGGEISAPQINAWQTRVIPTPQVTPEETAPTVAATTIFNPADAGYNTATQTGITPVQPKKKNYLLLWIAIIALLLSGTVLAIIYSGVFSSEPSAPVVETVEVPDLTNTDQTQARQLLEDAGLKFRLGDPVEDDTIPEGMFVSSDPKVGTQVDKDSLVTVHFSAGKGQVAVPDITGMTEANARLQLENAGLVAGSIERVDEPGQEAGIVFGSTPATNTMVDKGTSVSLVVATGQVTLPNLVGAVLDSAVNELSALSLSYDTTSEYSDQPQGTVIRQEPLAGKIQNNSRVKLVVSAGPEPTPEPTQDTTPTPEPTPTPDSGTGGTTTGNG